MTDEYINESTYDQISQIDLDILKNDEIENMSALDSAGLELVALYDDSGEPKKGGLIDPLLGTSSREILCGTCGFDVTSCVGHFGHINLACDVFNIQFLPYVHKILTCICIKCSKLLINKNEAEINDLLKSRIGRDRMSYIRNITRNVSMCKHPTGGCGAVVPKIKLEIKRNTGDREIYAEYDMLKDENDTKNKKNPRQVLTPDIIYALLKNISDADCEILGIDNKRSRPEDMIHTKFPVPPIQVRPTVKGDFMGGVSMEDDLTHKLGDIVKVNNRLIKYKDSDKSNEQNVKLLQAHIASYMDSDAVVLMKNDQNKSYNALASRLKSKNGRVRGNLMGKRCDFTGRTVITSDPTIGNNQLRVPVKIATNLTFPEIVTPYNIEYLTTLVRRGRDKYPGANFVYPMSRLAKGEKMRGNDLRFAKESIELHFGDIVERHLQDGDIVLLNRQPTLHKQSMMAHRIKVINDPNLMTYGLSVAITTPYNADFDGDEMNIFLPQSSQTQIELEELACVEKQIITPTTSKTIVGIVQDGLLGAYNLTSPTVRIDWRSAMNIMSYTTIEDFSVLKKNREYNGKELFSMIIPPEINVNKSTITIKNGEIVDGRLAKDVLGAKKKNNLIQLIWDGYGADETRRFIDNTQRLINNFNLWNGFSVGIGDIHVSEEINDEIDRMFKTSKLKVDHFVTKMENNPELMTHDLYEHKLFSELNGIRDNVSKLIMGNLEPDNAFNVMVQSGSKGDASNIGQMAGCLGLQAFEGKIMPKKYNSRTLAYFHQNDDRAESRGLVRSSFIAGLNFTEYVYHLTASRLGIIEQAVKTAETGYAQRKFIKNMEDIMIKNDGTVRNANNRVIQLVYGDSGTDTTKQYEYVVKMLEMDNNEVKNKFKFTEQELKNIKNFSNEDNNKLYDNIIKMRDLMRDCVRKAKLNFIVLNTSFMIPVNLNRIISTISSDSKIKSDEKLTPNYIINELERIMDNKYTTLICMCKKDQENKNSYKNIDEQIHKTTFKTTLYDALNPKRVIIELGLNKKQFDMIIDQIVTNFNKNMIEPGEMAGIVAAQSTGEPLTQLCTLKDTIVTLYDKVDGKVYHGEVGKFVEKVFNDNMEEVYLMPHTYDSSIFDTTRYLILSVNKDGTTAWKQISQISRHPTNGNLMKVTTESGRYVTTTMEHAYLKRNENTIISVKGKDLKIDDKLPICYSLPIFNNPIMSMSIGSTVFDFNTSLGLLSGIYLSNGFIENDKIYFDDSTKDVVIKCLTGYEYEQCDQTIMFDDLKTFLIENFGNDDKFISGNIFITNSNFILGLITGLYRYSGGYYDNEHVCFKHKNKNIIDDLAILSSYLNKCGKIVEDEDGYCYKLYNNVSENENLLNNVLFDNITEIKVIPDPHEYVYDFSVPESESFIVNNGLFIHNTLNSFHHSGIASMSATTQGLPRMKELLSVSKKQKTPQMIVYLKDEYMDNKDMAHKIASYIKNTTLGEIRDKLDIYYDPDPEKDNSIMKRDNVSNIFYGYKGSRTGCQSDITGLPFLARIELNREKMLEKEVSLLEIKSKMCNWWDKRLVQKTISKDEKKILTKITQFAILSNNDNDLIPIIHIRFNMKDTEKERSDKTTLDGFIDIIIDDFKLKGFSSITDIPAIEEKRVLIFNKDTGGIDRKSQYVIYTAGVNFNEIRNIEGIDLNKLISNNVVEVYKNYGIEIARAILLREIASAYENAGGEVNYQHITMIVDQMTSTGTIMSMDRHGMSKSDGDPLTRASFEKTVEQLTISAVYGESDHMKGVSARIMAGQVIKGGTGYCDIELDTDMIQRSEYVEGVDFAKKFTELNSGTIANDIIKKKHVSIFVPENE